MKRRRSEHDMKCIAWSSAAAGLLLLVALVSLLRTTAPRAQSRTADIRPAEEAVAGSPARPADHAAHASCSLSAARSLQLCLHRGPVAALTQMGVSCCDLDVFVIRDGTLLVGRASDLEAKLGKLKYEAASKAADLTMHDLRLLGLGAEYPVLGDVVRSFKAAEEARGARRRDPGVLFLELKGQAMTPHSLRHVAELAREAGLSGSVRVWATSVADDKLLSEFNALREVRDQVLTVRAVPDSYLAQDATRQPIPEPRLWLSAASQYNMIGPSIKHNLTVFSALKATGASLAAWVIDTSQDLHKALAIGVDIVITNDPLKMQAQLCGLCKARC